MINAKHREGGRSMKVGTLAIYDEDEAYANNLLEYISNKQGAVLDVIAFTNRDDLEKYCKDCHVDVLLISDRQMAEEITGWNIEKIILLNSGDIFSENEGYLSLYKYQSTDNIIREVLNYFVDINLDRNATNLVNNRSRLIGVYSPYCSHIQSVWAFTLGRVLANEQKTLFISLKEYSTLEKLLGETNDNDISDLVYFFRQNPSIVPIKLQAIKNSIDNMDYVMPMKYFEDLENISKQQWISFIDMLANIDCYECIVVELGNKLKGALDILEMCDRKYMPTEQGDFVWMEQQIFEEYLLKTGREELIEKIDTVEIPKDIEWEENFLDVQLWGKMGDKIRKLEGINSR